MTREPRRSKELRRRARALGVPSDLAQVLLARVGASRGPGDIATTSYVRSPLKNGTQKVTPRDP